MVDDPFAHRAAFIAAAAALRCPVRISCAYIFRVRLGEQFLLLGEPAVLSEVDTGTTETTDPVAPMVAASKNAKLAKPLKPIGGGYRFKPQTFAALRQHFGYHPAAEHVYKRETITGLRTAEDYDYRLLIESVQLRDFMRCFHLGDGGTDVSRARQSDAAELACMLAQGQAIAYTQQYQRVASYAEPTRDLAAAVEYAHGQTLEANGDGDVLDFAMPEKWQRENILDLRREFQEELQESNLLEAALGKEAGTAALEEFSQLHYCYKGRYYSAVKELRFACGALMLTDVVELVPTPAQQQVLLALQQAVQQHVALRATYNWVEARDFRSHLVPRASQLPNSMADLLPETSESEPDTTTITSAPADLRLADHCALLLTPHLVQPASVLQCLQEHEGNRVNAGVITTPRGWVA